MAKEMNFRNRVPKYPGRVRMIPVAGQANTYDMVRADEPTEEGTPLDKVAFDSIIHSRLTGRYYEPAAQRSVVDTRTLTVNPIPTSGWVNESDAKSQSGGYVIEASTAEAGYSVDKVFDGNVNTEWHSAVSAAQHHVQVSFAQPIKLKKVRLKANYAPNNQTISITVQGSNNGASWTNLHTIDYAPTTLSEISLSENGYFSFYRLLFSSNGSVYAYAGDWRFAEYEIESYNNDYVVGDGVPDAWTVGQRIMVAIPASAAAVGVVSNALNGVPVSTILQPGKRYELRYTGTSFVAKEV